MTWQGPEHVPGNSLRAAAPPAHWQQAAALATGTAPSAWVMFDTGSDVVLGSHEAVFKMSHPRWASEIEAEARLLRRVAGRLPVTTPAPLDHGTLDGWPWVLMSRIPGRALGEVWPQLEHTDRRRLARDLGRLLASLHALPFDDADAAGWNAFFDEMVRTAPERHARHGASPAWVARVAPLLAATPWAPTRLAWLHTEVLDQHVLVDQVDGRIELVGMLDFADGRVGHPGYELSAVAEFIFRGEAGLMRELLIALDHPALPPGPRTARELAAWGVVHQFGSIPRTLATCGAPEPADFDEVARRLYDAELP